MLHNLFTDAEIESNLCKLDIDSAIMIGKIKKRTIMLHQEKFVKDFHSFSHV